MLVGIHSEGWDYLILKSLLAKTLSILEQDMEVDPAGPLDSASGCGWSYVLRNIPGALRRFYHKSAKIDKETSAKSIGLTKNIIVEGFPSGFLSDIGN